MLLQRRGWLRAARSATVAGPKKPEAQVSAVAVKTRLLRILEGAPAARLLLVRTLGSTASGKENSPHSRGIFFLFPMPFFYDNRALSIFFFFFFRDDS